MSDRHLSEQLFKALGGISRGISELSKPATGIYTQLQNAYKLKFGDYPDENMSIRDIVQALDMDTVNQIRKNQ